MGEWSHVTDLRVFILGKKLTETQVFLLPKFSVKSNPTPNLHFRTVMIFLTVNVSPLRDLRSKFDISVPDQNRTKEDTKVTDRVSSMNLYK